MPDIALKIGQFEVMKNPNKKEIIDIISASSQKAARCIDSAGEIFVWPAEAGTHKEIADLLGIEYNTPPGHGTLLIVNS